MIRYVDVHAYDEQPDNEVLFRILEDLEPKAAALYRASQVKDPQPLEVEGQAQVKLFCTPWCPNCRRARAYLRDHNIPYVEINIARDRDAARMVRGWANGNETTPTFQVGERVVIDFRRAELDEILGIKE